MDLPRDRFAPRQKPAPGASGRPAAPVGDAAPGSGPARRRRVVGTDRVGWRRAAALIAALAVLIVLVVAGLSGNRPTRNIAQWIERSVVLGSGDSAWGARAEIRNLAFEDGWAELGQFNVKVYEPVLRRRFRAEFKLEGATDCGDKASFQEFMQQNYRFFREQVAIAVRASSIAELNDPERRVLRKRILAQVNRALGRPFLTSVDLPGFTLFESIAQSAYKPAQPPAPDTSP